MQAAGVLFLLTAFGGLFLASYPLRGRPRPPTLIALGHGGLAIVSFIALAYAAVDTGLPTLATIALIVFLLAALGGLTLFLGFHLREKPLPLWLVLGHGLTALVGVGLLWTAILQGG
jgi:hypothetical protein